MIVYDLTCASGGHVFEAWFGSSDDYTAQKARGLVTCPVCGSDQVDKAPMAPAVPKKGNSAPSTATHIGGDLEAVKSVMQALAEVQKKIIANSDDVGERFPDEARAIHVGDAEARSIYGKASPEEAQALRDEGVLIAPLPFPVIPAADKN